MTNCAISRYLSTRSLSGHTSIYEFKTKKNRKKARGGAGGAGGAGAGGLAAAGGGG